MKGHRITRYEGTQEPTSTVSFLSLDEIIADVRKRLESSWGIRSVLANLEARSIGIYLSTKEGHPNLRLPHYRIFSL